MRLSYDELENVKKKFGVDQLWSFSKFDSYRTSQYEWMLKYIKRLPENNETVSAYAPLGGAVHDIIERLYEEKIQYEDMLEEFEDAWTANIEVVEAVFDRSDTLKNDNIKNKYYADISHFFNNYNKLPYKMLNEQFVTIKIADDIVMQGYIDAIYKNEDGIYTIVDYKTSSKYTGKAINDHAAQLVLYAEALRQRGVPKDNIRVCWNFLKYCTVECEQVNGNIKERIIERYEIGAKLKTAAKTWLKKLGHEDDMDMYLENLVETNDLYSLPEDVAEKFKIKDCYVYVDDIWGFYKTLREEIIETVNEINRKTFKYNELMKDGKEEEAERLFWDDEESLKAQSYYYNNLCGYNIPTIKPYKEYLDKITKKNDDLLAKPSKKEEEDLSWLDLL